MTTTPKADTKAPQGLPLNAWRIIELHIAFPSPQMYISLAAVERASRCVFLGNSAWRKFDVNEVEKRVIESDSTGPPRYTVNQCTPQHYTANQCIAQHYVRTRQKKAPDSASFRLYSQLDYLCEPTSFSEPETALFDPRVWSKWVMQLPRKRASFRGTYHNNIPDSVCFERKNYVNLARCTSILFQYPRFVDDREVILASVAAAGADCLRRHGYHIGHCIMCEGAFMYILMCSHRHFAEDREILLAVAPFCPKLLSGKAVMLDRDFVLAAAATSKCLRYTPKVFRDDPEIVLAAVACYPKSMYYASPRLKRSKDFMLRALFLNQDVSLKDGIIAYVPKALLDNDEFMMQAVAKDGDVLEYASCRLQSDRDIVLMAVSMSGSALRFARECLQNDKEVVLAAVAQSASALQFASNGLRDEYEVVYTAALQSHEALQYASERLRGNEKLRRAVERGSRRKRRFFELS